jgi:hypothetical protein
VTTRQLLDMKEAAAVLGWHDRWAGVRLLRQLKAVERRIGRSILVVSGGEREGTRYRVTRSALNRHVSEIWDSSEKLLRSISSDMRKLRKQVGELAEKFEDLEFRLAACERAIGHRGVDKQSTRVDTARISTGKRQRPESDEHRGRVVLMGDRSPAISSAKWAAISAIIAARPNRSR